MADRTADRIEPYAMGSQERREVWKHEEGARQVAGYDNLAAFLKDSSLFPTSPSRYPAEALPLRGFARDGMRLIPYG